MATTQLSLFEEELELSVLGKVQVEEEEDEEDTEGDE